MSAPDPGLEDAGVDPGLDDPVLDEAASRALSRAERAREAGRFEEARALLEPLSPSAERSFQLGLVELLARRGAAAVPWFEDARTRAPGHALAWLNLGNAWSAEGDLARAEAGYREALRLAPELAVGHNNLGHALQHQGRLDEALRRYERALELDPGCALAWANLRAAASQAKDPGRFERRCRERVAAQPGVAEAWLQLGQSLRDQGRSDEAAPPLREAVALDPEGHAARLQLGLALQETGDLAGAAAAFEAILARDPAHAAAWNVLGGVWNQLGKVPEAIAAWERAVEASPGYHVAHSNRLLCLNYLSRWSAPALAAAHMLWGLDVEEQVAGAALEGHPNDPDPERPLRVGYVSADLEAHPVAAFFEPLLEAHDRARIEPFCYALNEREDEVSARLRASAAGWCEAAGLSDEALARRVQADRIDVLVDLSGHTGGNRLPVFARRPAPVQVTYLGYPNTTGLRAIDARLTDRWADPPGLADDLHSERVIRLPGGFLAYRPPADAPPLAPLAAGEPEFVTFGSFNNLTKLDAPCVAAWARLLRALPGARLLLKNHSLSHGPTRARVEGLFAAHGVTAERLVLLGRLGFREHLALYNRVGVALDPFPYHGTTTTCEALWMGVPVVTVAGDRHASRVGVSLLTRAGLPELIARDPEELVAIAASLAQDPPRLAAIKATLRPRLSAGGLLDGLSLARRIEEAYRELWRGWCARGARP